MPRGLVTGLVANPEAVMAAPVLNDVGQRALRERISIGAVESSCLEKPWMGLDAAPLTPEPARHGSLTVVGTGIRTVGQLTLMRSPDQGRRCCLVPGGGSCRRRGQPPPESQKAMSLRRLR